MSRIAFVFPGQGSQYVGMGKDFYDQSREARAVFDEADEILGIRISRICFDGPEDELRQTKNTQPGIFLHSMVIAKHLSNLHPSMVAGHSLGEYSALTVARAMTFEDSLKLVRLRGELMQKAGEESKGTMAAVVGLEPDVVEGLCAEASPAGIVQPANFNSPGQIVISGSLEGVHKGMDLAKQRGAKLVKELVVSGAFHSPLMESAREGLKKKLDETSIRDATISVYVNVTGEPTTKADELREMLYRQLTSPVRWEATVQNMVRDGAERFCEIGPGKVLQGLIKRTVSSSQVSGFDKYSDLTEL
ncbi:MAG: ACP S-malonyltransferase [Ignavibacteriae bacterium]|nr:ACP S-malonyltransferase [Ignavibacteriota bacterium]